MIPRASGSARNPQERPATELVSVLRFSWYDVAYNGFMSPDNVSGSRSNFVPIMIVAALMLICASVHGYRHGRELKKLDYRRVTHVTRGPEGYTFCSENPRGRLPQADMILDLPLPERTAPVTPDGRQIVFRQGKHEVDVYEPGTGRVIQTDGIIQGEGNKLMLRTKLNMSDWPPGPYTIGIQGDPFFLYCSFDFVDPRSYRGSWVARPKVLP